MRQARTASRRATSGTDPQRSLEADKTFERCDVADAGEHDPEDARVLHDGERLRRRAARTISRRISWPIRSAESSRSPSRARIAAESPSRSMPPCAVFGMEAEEAEDAEPVLGDPPLGLADEADTAGEQVRIAAERIVNRAVPRRPKARSSVKSRRRASASQSRPKRTTAWRPSVSTSSRSVVTW